MATAFGKSWYRVGAKNRRIFLKCASIVPRFLVIRPVDNLNLCTAPDNFETSDLAGNRCERILRTLKAKLPELFEVVKDPFRPNGYVARLSFPSGISVSEPVPNEFFEQDDDRVDPSLYWESFKKRLRLKHERLFQIQSVA